MKPSFEESCKNTVEKSINYIKRCIDFAESHPDFQIWPGGLYDGAWERYADDIRFELELTLFLWEHPEIEDGFDRTKLLDGFDSEAKATVNRVLQLLNKHLEIRI